jgi:hypothetical protein
MDEKPNDNVSHLILEHLRHIRGRVDTLAADSAVMKARSSSIEDQLVGIRGDIALLQRRFDLTDARLDRIEQRLELSEHPH